MSALRVLALIALVVVILLIKHWWAEYKRNSKFIKIKSKLGTKFTPEYRVLKE